MIDPGRGGVARTLSSKSLVRWLAALVAALSLVGGLSLRQPSRQVPSLPTTAISADEPFSMTYSSEMIEDVGK